MTHRILFVCLGNICRSPTAEAVFRHQVAQTPDLSVIVDSAGTSDWHVGDPPYGPMQKAAILRGYDLSTLRARQFTSEDFSNFDLIIAMDANNLDAIEDMRPQNAATTVALFTDFAPETGMDHVPDPYYTRDFDKTLDLVETASRGLITSILASQP